VLQVFYIVLQKLALRSFKVFVSYLVHLQTLYKFKQAPMVNDAATYYIKIKCMAADICSFKALKVRLE
jgi:hypothetical protein